MQNNEKVLIKLGLIAWIRYGKILIELKKIRFFQKKRRIWLKEIRRFENFENKYSYLKSEHDSFSV